MPFRSHRDDSPRLPPAAVVALAAIFLLSGLTRDPWKTEDAIHLSIAHAMAVDASWLFPHVAGEPWPHTAPLFHWVAAALGRLLDGWLALHEAARLASALFGALFLFALTRAAAAFDGPQAARVAPLLALGTLGLLLPLHEAQPAVAGLACAALAWWGGAIFLGANEPAASARWRGALLLGCGSGLAFLAHGLVGLLMVIAVLPAPTFRRDWPAFVVALAVAGTLAALWPLALSAQSPDLWQAWWHNELAELWRSRRAPEAVHAELVAWGYWPILPLALWTLWLERRRLARFSLPLLGTALGLSWFVSGGTRLAALLPAMPPLLLVAAVGAERLRRGAAHAWNWFALMCFTFFGALVWLGASAQALGWPPKVAANFAKIAPGHVADYPVLALAWAAGLTLVWLWSWRLPRAPWRASLHWAAGVVLLWTLTTTLWFDWLDHHRSHRAVIASLRAALPTDVGCIERLGVGTPQRALLDYHAGIRTRPPGGEASCAWRLVIDRPERAATPGWQVVWEGSRPGDRRERWFLERRDG